MDQLAAVRAHLSHLSRVELAEFAEKSGVSLHTLLKVVNGATEFPRYKTVSKAWNYLQKRRQAEQEAAV